MVKHLVRFRWRVTKAYSWRMRDIGRRMVLKTTASLDGGRCQRENSALFQHCLQLLPTFFRGTSVQPRTGKVVTTCCVAASWVVVGWAIKEPGRLIHIAGIITTSRNSLHMSGPVWWDSWSLASQYNCRIDSDVDMHAHARTHLHAITCIDEDTLRSYISDLFASLSTHTHTLTRTQIYTHKCKQY